MLSVFMIWFILISLIVLYKSNFYSSLGKGNIKTSMWASPFESGFMSHKITIKSFSSSIFTLLVFFVIFDLEVSLLLKSVFQEEFYKKSVYYLSFLVMIATSFLLEVLLGFVRWSK